MGMPFGLSGRRWIMAGIACAIAAVILCLTGLDLLTFLLPASSRTGMSGTWDSVKLGWMGTLCLVASLLCGWNARRIFQPSSQQQALADRWSPLAVLLWWTTVVLGLLVYYPLPYFNHHVDKFLLVLIFLLAWAGWLCAHPSSLERVLNSRSYGWLRVVLINALVSLLLAEGAMRLADPLLAQSGLFSARSDTPGGGIPFQVVGGSIKRTNSRGFRDRERALARTSAALRIVALGDSFTWGAGASYDEGFITLVERRLHEVNPGTEVINLGLVGYQPEEYLALLKAHGIAYQPDLILVNFYIGNDLMPAQGAPMIVAGHRHRVHVNGNWFHDHLSWDHWYLSHDLAYASLMAMARIRHAEGQTDLGMWTPVSDAPNPPHSATSFSGWSPRYVRMILGMSDQYLKRDTPAFLARWHETRRTLEQLDNLSKERGIPWALILLPAEEQVDRELQRLYLEMLRGQSEDYDFDKPQRLLGEWSKDRGVKVIDLTPQFRAHVAGQRLYVDNDIHWNSNGNALAAQIIIRELLPDLRQNGTALRINGSESSGR